METVVNKTLTERNAKLVALGAVLGCLGIVCIILHISPVMILEALKEFAKHHYFLAGFIFLILSLVCLKFYFKKNEETGLQISRKKSRVMKRRILLSNLRRSIGFIGDPGQSLYIKKEKITSLKFSNNEVLPSREDQELRKEVLQKARVLGNLYKQKVIICFKDNDSSKHTLATIWHTDDEHVSLKGGATIPVKRIYKIEI